MHARPRPARWAMFAIVCVGALGTGCPRSSGQGDLATLPSITTDDPRAEADLRAARDAAEAGHAEEAARRYRRFLEERPSDPLVPAAELGLGRVLLANGDIEAALERFARVAAVEDPRVAEAGRFYRGVGLHLAGQHEAALELLTPLIGRTVDPDETVLLLRTLASAAERTGRIAIALGALDRLAGSQDVSVTEREQARTDLREIVGRATPEAVARAYEDLPRDGIAWPEVAQRALRLAFEAADMARVGAIATELRARQIPMSDELAQLAVRAERTERADPRVIGAILPLTGRGREVGQRALRGLMLAAGVPLDGGPPGPDAPQLVLRDDGGDPQRAARAVDELVSVHRAIAIVGPLEGESARAAARRAQELGVPMITLVSDALVVGAGESVFRLFVSPREEALALVGAARARGATRFAVLRPRNAYGERMAEAFSAALAESGGELVATETYEAGATAFGDVVRRLSTHRFDALFVPDSAQKLTMIAPALAAAGLSSSAPAPRGARTVHVLAPSVASDVRLLRASARYLQGALFASAFHAASGDATSRAFVDSFAQRYSETPDAFAAYAYDAFRLARRPVEAGQTTRAGVSGWLRDQGRIDTAGASGGLGAHRGPARPSRVLELRGEQLVEPSVPAS